MKNLRTKTRGRYIFKGVVFGLLAAVVFALALMLLWNWLMPAIFGLGLITFWQALGLLVLSKIIFGGGRHPHRDWHNNERSKMHKEMFSERFKKAHSMYHQKPEEGHVE